MERADRAAIIMGVGGLGSTVVSVTLPLAYPEAPLIVWRSLLWFGVALMAISGVVFAKEHLGPVLARITALIFPAKARALASSVSPPTEKGAGHGKVAVPPADPEIILGFKPPRFDIPKVPRPYLRGADREFPARPHLSIQSVHLDPKRRGDRVIEASAVLVVSNDTDSRLNKCSVTVESIERKNPATGIGVLTSIGLPLSVGGAPSGTFSLAPGGHKILGLIRRPLRVATEPPFLLTTSEEVVLKDFSTYEFNLLLDAGTPVVTRAVVEARLLEYEELNVSLIGQTYWRRSR